MASVIDSEAHFTARASEMGITDVVRQALQDNGIKTLSHLAFAIGQPNTPLSNDDITNFMRPLLTRDPTLQGTLIGEEADVRGPDLFDCSFTPGTRSA